MFLDISLVYTTCATLMGFADVYNCDDPQPRGLNKFYTMSKLNPASGKEVVLKVVRYGSDVRNVMADMSDRNFELETAYHVAGEGHYLYFCRYYAMEDVDKRLRGQVGTTPTTPHITRNKGRSNKI